MARGSSRGPTNLRVIPGGASDHPEDDDATERRTAPVHRHGPSPEGYREPSPGDLISGRYRLAKLLGEGGMGRVFLATDELYSEQYQDRSADVAIKFLGRKFAEHSSARMALQRETRKSQQLSHPNVVRVMHFDQDGPHAYMIMEYMKGLPLDDFIRERAPTGLPFDAAFALIEGMALGLGYIHGQGLVHADFKPNNVFVNDDDTAKVLDLGIARVRDDVTKRADDTRFDPASLGALTPGYASCEMFEGAPPDPRDDVYALACVAYELLTGHHPFNGTWSIHARSKGLKPQRVPGLNGRRWHALQRGLAFDRPARLGDTTELLEGLRDDRARRRRLIAGLGGLAAVGAAVSGTFAMLAMQPPDPDQAFLESLATSGSVTLSQAEAKRVETWLEQGQVYVEVARSAFQEGSLGTAHHVLRGGADNAYWAFTSVLERTDHPAARSGVLEIIDAYADWAESTAAAGAIDDALWAACQGLAIHPRHVRLNALASEYALALNQTDVTSSCQQLTRSGAPPSSAPPTRGSI